MLHYRKHEFCCKGCLQHTPGCCPLRDSSIVRCDRSLLAILTRLAGSAKKNPLKISRYNRVRLLLMVSIVSLKETGHQMTSFYVEKVALNF